MSDKVTAYQQFLASKVSVVRPAGPQVAESAINPVLFPFQQVLTRWSVRKGRCAIFADTGLGKTPMQLEWARLIGQRTLIVAPLSVARQTVREAQKLLGMTVRYVRSQGEVDGDGIYITNYEMTDRFEAAQFGAVVLDESSILKGLDGKTRQRLTEQFQNTPYRLCCTATPAPNDITEIANHAEFLGIMTRADMLATFFVHDDDGWRLKKHAVTPFYRWLASWGMSVRKPSDLGDFDDNGYILPTLNINPLWVQSDYRPDDQLFFTELHGIQDRSAVRKATMQDRIAATADMVNGSNEQWLLWCGLNDESTALARMIPDALEVTGSDAAEYKASSIEEFQDGQYRVLITKPKIAGFGMNFQNCHNMAFVGLSDSWEAYYQCIRRCWRFGQTQPVNAYVVLSEQEQGIYYNVMRKEQEAKTMSDNLIENVQQFEQEEIASGRAHFDYRTDTAYGENWELKLGDSAERLAEIKSESVGLSVFSPPFQSLYVYSPTERDLGNSKTSEEFFEHFGYIIDELLRVTQPGRLCCVHVAQVPAMLSRDNYIGLKDFRGATIRAFERAGWIYSGEPVIKKNPQAQAIRTHSKALLFNQLHKDSSWSRPALLDYILVMRKPGDNADPIIPDLSNEEWIYLAGGIWEDVSESDTLQYSTARDPDDERHLCPLQLKTIEHCIRLWSNPGDLILSPFAGIGSEGYQAIKFGRRFVGCELKPSYWKIAVQNLRRAEDETHVATLFDLLPLEDAA